MEKEEREEDETEQFECEKKGHHWITEMNTTFCEYCGDVWEPDDFSGATPGDR